MISMISRGHDRYGFCDTGRDLGWVTVSHNPYHNAHCYLELGLTEYDPAFARELFSLLRRELGKPLQVMVYTTPEIHRFLTAGGFTCRRKCYELRVTPSDLAGSLTSGVELRAGEKGSAIYDACCSLLYGWYRETHAGVSPLTVPREVFCQNLPERVLWGMAEGKPVHCAFVEPGPGECEIAYVATAAPSSFSRFAESLVGALFRQYDALTAECDDTDPAAMELLGLFALPHRESYDSYILA